MYETRRRFYMFLHVSTACVSVAGVCREARRAWLQRFGRPAVRWAQRFGGDVETHRSQARPTTGPLGVLTMKIEGRWTLFDHVQSGNLKVVLPCRSHPSLQEFLASDTWGSVINDLLPWLVCLDCKASIFLGSATWDRNRMTKSTDV